MNKKFIKQLVEKVNKGQHIDDVGTKLYFVTNKIEECEVRTIEITKTGLTIKCVGGYYFNSKDIGKKIFFDKKEAEQNLKNGGKKS